MYTATLGLVGLSDLQDGTQMFAAFLIYTAVLVGIANVSSYLNQVLLAP